MKKRVIININKQTKQTPKPLTSTSIISIVKLACGIIVRYGIVQFKALISTDPTTHEADLDDLGEWLCSEIQSNGPIYVKIGQILGTRNEVPAFICKALERLQDQADGIPFSDVESTLNLPPNVSHVSNDPIAAASIGIVYIGTWTDDGTAPKNVAIKVMRPTIRKQLCRSLWSIARVTRIVSKRSKSETMAYTLSVVRQYRRAIYKELDYVGEAKNIDLLAESLDPISEWNRVPQVYAASKDYIVMEYVPGVRVTDVEMLRNRMRDISLPNVANNVLEGFLFQCLVSKTFHADPHPGNISVGFQSDGGDPYLIWYDGGSIVECTVRWREDLIELAMAVLKSDVPNVVVALEEMGIIQNGPKFRRAVTKLVRIVLANSSSNVSTSFMDVDSIGGRDTTTQLFRMVQEQMDRDPLWKEDLRQSFANDSPYVILGKSVIMINQVCNKLDPSFNLIQRSIPILERFWNVINTSNGTLSMSQIDIGREITTAMKNLSQMPQRVSMLEGVLMDMNDELSMRQLEMMRRQRISQRVNWLNVGAMITLILVHGNV
jgi:predicted unusual protein kinase regulating ubiquinone biosynthesis (AarF/ABC1/UbiB family)